MGTSVVHLNRYPNGGVSTTQIARERIAATQPGLLPEKTVRAMERQFGGVSELPATSVPDSVSRIVDQIRQLEGRDPQGPKALIVVDLKMAMQLETEFEETIGPTWWQNLPVLIIGVTSESAAADPDALLAYLLDLLGNVDSRPGGWIELIETIFTLELEKATYFLRSSA